MSQEWISNAAIFGIYAAIFAVPCLVLLGFIGLARRLRHELPRWRSVAGLVSLALVLLSWLFFAGPHVLVMLAPADVHLRVDSDRSRQAVFSTALAGTLMAMALKRAPRIYALLAGILEIVFLASVI